MKKRLIASALTTICLTAFCSFAQAQNAQVQAALDSMTIVVGNQVGLTVEASYPEDSGATLRQLSDTLTSQVEIVSLLGSDTTKSNGIELIRQRYLVTSFDSGMHYIPPVEVLVLPDGTSLSTPDMALNVVNPFQTIEVDEQTGVAKIVDIKNAKDAPFVWQELIEYWPWLVLAIAVIGLTILGIWLYRRHKNDSSATPKKEMKPAEPCYVVALRELSRIKDEKLWQRNLFKEYYSELTDTLRRYISERYSLSAMEKTTDEIVEEIFPVLDGDIVNKNRLQEVLQLADFVKFAKHEPLPDQNDMAIKKAIDFVKDTTPREPAINREETERNDE